jgi:1,4-alpha-glucan branching enzyme
MSIKKHYLKDKPICKVTFQIPEKFGKSVKKAHLVGEFNNWKPDVPMKKLKNGAFTVTIDLEKDNEYQFRYLLANQRWENDPEADKYVPTPFGDSQNSVVII